MAINGGTILTSPVDAEDAVFLTSVGQIIAINQNTIFENIGSGQIVTIKQKTQVNSSNLIISFEQAVRNAALPDYLTKNGFRPIITIGGYILPDNQICDTHTITRQENNATVTSFTIKPPTGVLNAARLQGLPVTYDIQRTTGTTRIFTGVVNIPQVDLINKKIKIDCTDTREDLINAQLASFKNTIGWYDTMLQGTPLSTYDEVTKRLTTVPYSLDFNAYGKYTYTPWAAKASADITLGNSAVYYRNPQVVYSSRLRTTNQVNLTFNYRYPRLHHGEVAFSWHIPYNIGQFLINGYTMCARSIVEAAISGAGWPLRGSIGYTPMFLSGSYTVNGSPVIFSTTQSQFATEPQTTPNPIPGGPPIPVKDANGAQVYQQVVVATTDFSKLFCNGAAWIASKQWAQTVTEQFTITIAAPQSQAQYGVVPVSMSGAIDTVYDVAAWENQKGWKDSSPLLNGAGNYFNTAEPNLTNFYAATTVLLNQASTQILAAHRDTRIIFETPGLESLDLSHTVNVTATVVSGKGKVQRIVHTINVNEGMFTTYAELALSRVTGSQTASTLVPPTRVVDSPTLSMSAVALQSHYGQDPALPPAAKWTGFIGNSWVTTHVSGGTNLSKTNYPVSFIVDTPAIPDSMRLAATITAAQTYNVSIPNDTLTVTL